MASLFAPPPPAKHHTLPAEIRDAILALKAEYPPLRPRELTRICSIRFKRSISHHTVARVLATGSFPLVFGRRYPPYHDAAQRAPADPAAARHAIVQLHVDGWTAKSIAGYLATSRQTVHATLKRWIAEGCGGSTTRAMRAPACARPGALRADAGDGRHPRVAGEPAPRRVADAHRACADRYPPQPAGRPLGRCGRIMALNRALYGLPRAAGARRGQADALRRRAAAPVLERRYPLPDQRPPRRADVFDPHLGQLLARHPRGRGLAEEGSHRPGTLRVA